MEINLKFIVVVVAINVILAVSIIIFGDMSIFIEEGVMNFWSMIGALGAFICSFILLILKIAEKVESLTGRTKKPRGY